MFRRAFDHLDSREIFQRRFLYKISKDELSSFDTLNKTSYFIKFNYRYSVISGIYIKIWPEKCDHGFAFVMITDIVLNHGK